VTTRAIPPENVRDSGTSTTTAPQLQHHHPQTINPSLLERSTESTAQSTSAQTDLLATRGKSIFDVTLNKRLAPNGHDGEIKRHQARNADVLYRARELGMKIWTLEKLQRMMTGMFDMDGGYQTGHITGGNAGSVAAISRTHRDTDLSQLLRNERINGPSDRDPTVATKEMTIFKGPFIYIHDIDEKQRPIMVREYAKVTRKEDGDWPQFRCVAKGKCPFIEEVDRSKEAEREKEMIRLQRQQEKEKLMIPRTRDAAVAQPVRMQPPKVAAIKKPLAELDDGSNRNITVLTTQTNPFDPVRTRGSAEPSSKGPQNAFVSRARAGRLFAGEPVASGVQPSNITSAIRSQMISSTSAQPGAKAGTSKEVHGLQRKVLEKNNGGAASYGGATTSHRTADIATTKEEMTTRAVRRNDKLDLIEEDVDPSEREENARKAESALQAQAVQQRKLEKRDLKPGYCENCQDKFEVFDDVRPQTPFESAMPL
jgi:regulatory subunit for Cdc7p protein kinase